MTWRVDGVADPGTSPSRQSGLRRGYCYRWRVSLADRNKMVGVAVSGQILVSR